MMDIYIVDDSYERLGTLDEHAYRFSFNFVPGMV